MAAGREIPRAADVLRQQARPHRRQFRHVRRHDQGPSRRPPGRSVPADRHRGRLQGPGRPGREPRDHLARREPRRQVRLRRDPGRPQGRRRRRPHGAGRDGGRAGRRGDGSLSERRRAGRGDPQEADPQGHAQLLVRASAVRLGVQEQGRPALARRGHRLSAEPARHPAGRGPQARRRDHRHPRAFGRRAVLGAGVQDHERPVRRHADLRPHLFGHAGDREPGPQFGQGQEGKGRPHAADACQRPRGHPGRLRGRHRRSRRPQGHHHRRYAVGVQRADHPRAHGIPRPGHRGRGRAQDQGRPGEDGRRPQPPGPRGPVVPRDLRP